MQHDRIQFVDDVSTFVDPGALVVGVSLKIRRKRALFGVLRKQLQFPDFFGWNWDALNDCLRDLSWLDGVARVILVHDGVPFRAGSRSRRAYLELLRSLAAHPPPGPPVISVVFPRSAIAELSPLA